MAGFAYWLLQFIIIKSQGQNSKLKQAIGKDFKGYASLVCYIIGIGFSFYNQWIAATCYVIVALMWMIPDKRIEKLFDPID